MENERDCKSFETFLEAALKAAADQHAQCCHEESNWAPFYARFLARRLRPLLCAIQTYVDRQLASRLAPAVNASWVNPRDIREATEAVRVATVRGHWDRGTIDREVHAQDAGPTWFLP